MKLIFKGVVQGVGFRPTIYRVAKKLGLKGYVLNKGSEVEVVIDKDSENFIKSVKKQLPSIAKITDIIIKPENRTFSDFRILQEKIPSLDKLTKQITYKNVLTLEERIFSNITLSTEE